MDKNNVKSEGKNVVDVNNNKGGDKMEKKVTTFKIGDIQSCKVVVNTGRGGNGTSELGNLIRTKANETLKASGDAVRLGEFVSFIKGTHEYREVYTRCKMVFSSKSSSFSIRKYDVQGKEMSFLVRK